jgi:hypothetical protein
LPYPVRLVNGAMRIGLLVLGGGSWGFPSFSTDDQARFSSLEKQKISRLILAMRVCPTVRVILSAHYKNKEEGPWKVQKLNQPKQ